MYLKHLAQLALSGSIIPNLSSNPNAIPNPNSPSISTSKNEPGYSLHTPSTVTNSSFTFGQHYAVLNLDLIDGLVSSFNDTDAGEKWIENVASWVDAVHDKKNPPLTVYTRIYFSAPWRPEVLPSTPFAKAVASLPEDLTESSPESQVYHAFKPKEELNDEKKKKKDKKKKDKKKKDKKKKDKKKKDKKKDKKGGDVVLRKGRYYAGDGNSLEEILSTRGIDTVILSGVRTSGVILSTAFRLFDLNYKVYVIANNTIETSSHAQEVHDAILQGIFPKMPVDVITIEQAIKALKRSG